MSRVRDRLTEGTAHIALRLMQAVACVEGQHHQGHHTSVIASESTCVIPLDERVEYLLDVIVLLELIDELENFGCLRFGQLCGYSADVFVLG